MCVRRVQGVRACAVSRVCVRVRVRVRVDSARRAARLGGEMLRDGPRQAEAIVGRGAASELVDDHEGARRGALEDGGGLEHLGHEGRDAARLQGRRAWCV